MDWRYQYTSGVERMRLAIALARENVLRGTGGPFGAAVFESDSGKLVSVGMNLVVAHHNCTLHGEMVAFMMAQQRLASYTLRAEGMPRHELVSSCEPCAMCLGATSWSGVQRLVYGATADDARRLGFDEGPVFAESYDYLATRGIEVVRALCRDEASAVFEIYRERNGSIYNG